MTNRLRGLGGERGVSAPVFIVLIAAMVLILGGISVDLWRVLAEHRKVAGLVDGAAIAGVTGVQTDQLYEQPELDPVLDPEETVFRVCDYLGRNGVTLTCPGEVSIVVVDDTVTVGFAREVEVTLLQILSLAGGNTDPIEVGSVSTAVVIRSAP